MLESPQLQSGAFHLGVKEKDVHLGSVYAAGKRTVEQPLSARATRRTCSRSLLWFRVDVGKVQLNMHLK